MRIITLTTDLGSDSHYLAILKASLLARISQLQIVDISHNHEPFDMVESTYIFGLCYESFPPGSLHIYSVNNGDAKDGRILLTSVDEQHFILPDNGALSLIFPERNLEVYEVVADSKEKRNKTMQMGNIAAALLNETPQTDQRLQKFDNYYKRSVIRPVIMPDRLTGTIMFNDSFGNAHSNITKKDFEEFVRNNKFRILLSRHEWVESLNVNLSETRDGDSFCTFNNKGMLMIGVKKGKTSQLLNLTKNKTVSIELI